jgi:hypothetical protein
MQYGYMPICTGKKVINQMRSIGINKRAENFPLYRYLKNGKK